VGNYKSSNLGGTLVPFKVGTGLLEASAAFEVASTTGGFLLPRMTTVQRLAITTPAEGLQVFDTDIKRLFLYANGSWTREEAESIESDLTMYVDGTTGNDSNDGLGWATAKKTFAFLRSSSSDAIPREINADLLISFRNTIRASSADGLLVVDGFYGSGTITIQGELTAVETFTATGYENDPLVRGSMQWVSDATKSWTPDQWRRHFVDLGHTWKYPIRTNNATTLWMGFGDEQSGSYAATIYSAPEILRELDSNPGVKYVFNYDKFVYIHNCNLTITLRNAWIDDDATDFFMAYVDYCTRVTFEFVAAGNLGTFSCKYFSLDQSYLNITNYGYWALADVYAGMQNTAIDSVDATGYGVYINGNASCWFAECWIGHQLFGISPTENSIIVMNRRVYIQECDVGIYLNGADLNCSTPMPEPLQLRFDTVVKAITGLGRVYKTLPFEIIGFDVTDEFYFSDTDSGTFLDFSNDALRSRLQMQFAYANIDYEPLYFDEYDNDASGLTATRFQTAIDELAANQTSEAITSPLTMYVDGTTGDDANNGLAWGTAKKTLGFLVAGQVDALPREINAAVVINVRNDIRARSNSVPPLIMRDFYGSGSISITGVLTSVGTFTASTYENDLSVRRSRLWITDGTKSWTPNQWRRHFVDIGSGRIYPVQSNNATTLNLCPMSAITGTPAGTIYSAPEILTEVVTNPGVKYDFAHPGQCDIRQNTISIFISNLWFDEYAYAESIMAIVRCNRIEFTCVALINFAVDTCDYVSIISCYSDLPGSLYSMFEQSHVEIFYSVIDSTDSSGYGIYFNGDVILRLFSTWMGNQITGYWLGASSHMWLYSGVYLENITDGILLFDSTFHYEDGGVNAIRFDTVTRAFSGSGDIVVSQGPEFLEWGVTQDIAFSDVDTGTFAELDAGTLSSRGNISITYLDADYRAVVLPEYDNTVSGLLASRYQTAIDEIAARESTPDITADETFYVDGDAGSDAADGLSWGTAKKTFAFLRTHYGEVKPLVTVRVYARGTVLSADNVGHLQIKRFTGGGTIEIIGEPTVVVATLTPTAYQNTSTAWDYHAYVDVSGAGWTPNEYQGRYIKVAGNANYYPILSNTTERLWSTDLPSMSGATRFDIADMTIIRPATVAVPGTMVDYSDDYIEVQDSSINKVVIKNFRVERENRTYPQYWIMDRYIGESLTLQNVSFEGIATIINSTDAMMTLTRCYVDLRDFGIIGSGPTSISGSCLFADDGGVYEGYGFYVNFGATSGITNSHVVGMWYGVEETGRLFYTTGTLFRDCLYGIFAQSESMNLCYGAAMAARFKDCGTCIALQQATLMVHKVANHWVVDNCTTQLWLADGNTALFSEIGTRAIANAATATSVVEYDFDVVYEPANVEEYDNGTSGLTATRFQTAIDEIVANRVAVIQNHFSVGQVGSDCNFTPVLGYGAITAAVAAAIAGGHSATNPYVIDVYPGTYLEPAEIPVDSGLFIRSMDARADSVYVVAMDATKDLFVMNGGSLHGLHLLGVSTPGKALVKAATPGSLSVLQSCAINACYQGILVEAGAALLILELGMIIGSAGMNIGVGVSVDGVGSFLGMQGCFAMVPAAVLPLYAPANPLYRAISVTDHAEALISTGSFRVATQSANTGDVIFADDGAQVTISGVDISNSDAAVHIGSVGTGTVVSVQGGVSTGNNMNVVCESATGKVFETQSVDSVKQYLVAGAELIGAVQIRNDKMTAFMGTTRLQYLASGRQVDFGDFFEQFLSTGVVEGGEITPATGLYIDVAAGKGWVRRPHPNHDGKWVTWDLKEDLLLTASNTNYVYVDGADGVVKNTTSPVAYGDSILLRTLVTDGSGIRFSHQTRNYLTAPMEQLRTYLLATRPRALVSGLTCVAGTGVRKITTESGSYCLGIDSVSYTGVPDATWSYFYGAGGATEVASVTQVNITQYDLAGVLTTMTPTWFRADTLVLTSDGRLSLIYGTEEFETQVEAEAATSANIPTFLEASHFELYLVVVEQGVGIASFIDIRPQPGAGIGAGGGAGTSDHGLLSGLTPDDDHTQYLLVAGTRAMSGDLQMGTHDITGIGNVDGVDVSAHAARHLPGGLDFLATATPVSIGTSNVEGDAASFAKSNHQHDHANQLGGSLHAGAVAGVSAGFISAAGQTKLAAAAEGPGSAVVGNIATFSNINGKVLQDGGTAISALVTKATLTTKGDILGTSAASTPARVGVGGDGYPLIGLAAATPGAKFAEITDTVNIGIGVVTGPSTGATPQVVGIYYGTTNPPAGFTSTPVGTIWIKHEV